MEKVAFFDRNVVQEFMERTVLDGPGDFRAGDVSVEANDETGVFFRVKYEPA